MGALDARVTGSPNSEPQSVKYIGIGWEIKKYPNAFLNNQNKAYAPWVKRFIRKARKSISYDKNMVKRDFFDCLGSEPYPFQWSKVFLVTRNKFTHYVLFLLLLEGKIIIVLTYERVNISCAKVNLSFTRKVEF